MKRFFSNCITLDSKLFLSIHNLSGKRFLDFFFYLVTKIADGWIYGVLAAAYLVFRTGAALMLLPAFCCALLLECVSYQVIKKNVKRLRPFNKIEGITYLVIPPDEFSFPSGHTAAAAAFSVLCTAVFPHMRLPLCIYTAIVGFSRVYNGVHYPGDIFAGALLGAFSAKISIILFY